MSTMQPLLIELGTEELPINALPQLAQALFDGIVQGLQKRGIAFDASDAKPLYSPRRLAVLLPAVASSQPPQHTEVLGPYVNVALDADGAPTKALQGFAGKAGVAIDALEKTTDNKGERFVYRAHSPGASTSSLLPQILHDAISAMPIPKPMRWGSHSYAFARPVHWLVMLFGDNVVDAELFGVRAGRDSYGHRFMHPHSVSIASPQTYQQALNDAYVLVDADLRRQWIVEQVQEAAAQAGGIAHIDAANLEQVNGLTEWPQAVLCQFDSAYLHVPQEALIATMQANQKYFPIVDAQGQLTAHFVGIANIISDDIAQVQQGYERVIRPRFADAKFFFDEDLKQGLSAMNEGLASVKYQDKLGSVADKVQRVCALAEHIAAQVNVDGASAARAAHLAKADLQSRMVGEFPELQGIAGRYYARAQGEDNAVANAIDQAYQPRFSGDAIAADKLGQVLAIAERLDTLAGGFAAGLKPSGNKDPFALRRNALGLARTLLEGGFDLLPYDLISHACTLQPVPHDALTALDLTQFVYERLRGYYADKGTPSQQFEAVYAVPHASLPDFQARLNAIADFIQQPEALTLAAANKRISNILRKVDQALPAHVDAALLHAPAERALAEAVDAAIAETDALLEARDYSAVLHRLAQLRPQVDAFFDTVMVNADDAAVRINRLALLQRLSGRLTSVAAIELLS